MSNVQRPSQMAQQIQKAATEQESSSLDSSIEQSLVR